MVDWCSCFEREAPVNERNIAEAHNIIGALLKNKCVCEGFAKRIT